MLAPGDWTAGFVVLLYGDVDHEAFVGGTVPVVLAGLKEDAVAGADRFDRAAFALAESGALGDEARLAVSLPRCYQGWLAGPTVNSLIVVSSGWSIAIATTLAIRSGGIW